MTRGLFPTWGADYGEPYFPKAIVGWGKFSKSRYEAESQVAIRGNPKASNGACNTISNKVPGLSRQDGGALTLSMTNWPVGKYKLNVTLSYFVAKTKEFGQTPTANYWDHGVGKMIFGNGEFGENPRKIIDSKNFTLNVDVKRRRSSFPWLRHGNLTRVVTFLPVMTTSATTKKAIALVGGRIRINSLIRPNGKVVMYPRLPMKTIWNTIPNFND